jgi:hypothetical protein
MMDQQTFLKPLPHGEATIIVPRSREFNPETGLALLHALSFAKPLQAVSNF